MLHLKVHVTYFEILTLKELDDLAVICFYDFSVLHYFLYFHEKAGNFALFPLIINVRISTE